jgi:outer membrane protein TolC
MGMNAGWRGLRRLLAPICAALLLLALSVPHTHAQCQGKLDSLEIAATCTARNNAPISKADIDPKKAYSLEELIAIAESNHPRTRIAWEAAKQAAERLGIARSDYYPHLAILALGGDQRVIEPWPKPLGAPSGYFLIELPATEAGVELKYNVYDFGRRGARVEVSKALRLAAAAAFQRTNQDVAFRVVTDYFNLITAQERLEASRQRSECLKEIRNTLEAGLRGLAHSLEQLIEAKPEAPERLNSALAA